MTVSYYQAELVLGGHLRTLPGVPPIAWDSTAFVTPRSLWLRPSLLPGQPDPLFVGRIASVTRIGIYRIGVFAPSGLGIKTASEMADRIINHFEQTPVLDPQGLNINVEMAWRSPAVTEPEWYQVPVSVSFSFVS